MSSKVRTLEHIADLRRQPGTQRPVVCRLPAAVLGDLVTSTSAVPDTSTVELDAVAEATGADVVVTGTVTFEWEGDCRRCLDQVAGATTVPLREVFEPEPVEGETWPIDADSIDLGPVLHDAVLLALPLVPLCSPHCAGPDPARFPAHIEDDDADSDADDAGGDVRPVDPRWAALDELRFE